MTAVVVMPVINVVVAATVGGQVNGLVGFLRAHPEVDPRVLAEKWYQEAQHVLDPVAARKITDLAVYEVVLRSDPA